MAMLATVGSGLVRGSIKDILFAGAAVTIAIGNKKYSEGGEQASAEIEVIIDAVAAVLTVIAAVAEGEDDPKVATAMTLESIGALLELVGFAKGTPIETVTIPAQSLCYGVAGSIRWAT
ncbi:hypothetical protein RB2150_09254 [Rhodobacterales bacterium HTCC2150]|nr:hypothetical protein RB2150_09254 [Rhodobacterales bacterium HTCC2150] [Rhodobacteraceae bacterium HTCC2150]